MTKFLLNLLFLCLAMAGFSQPNFTEKTLTDMRQRMITDWDNYFKNEVSPDYVMQGHVGQTCDINCIAELHKNATLLEWPMEQIKIRQVGNVAIVTGISHHVALFKKSNTTVKNNQRFTDTYEFQKGKWMWLTAQFTNIAPPAFTEQTLADLHKEVIADGKKHFNERFSPNYEMTLPDGTKMDYASMKNFVGQRTVLEWPVQDVKIRQSGNIAIATGIRSPLSLIHETNQKIRQHQRFTTTLEYQNGKWLNVSSQYTNIAPPALEEQAAVKKAIEDESEAFHFNDDRNVFLSYWKMDDATRMFYSGKTGLTKLDAKMMKGAAESGQIPKANKIKSTYANYAIRASGNTAWATFDQSNEKGHLTHEFRCLEKVNGAWKIVSSSVHDTEK